MSFRKKMLSTTALVALGLGWVATLSPPAAADDLIPTDVIPTKAPPLPQQLPAVDGFNAKWEAIGGAFDNTTYTGSKGSLSSPIARQFGVQVDALAADYGGSFLGGVGGHLFWRDPSIGLLGIYASDSYLDRFGGLNVAHVAPEFEGYWNRWSIQGIAGIEFGNSTNAIVAGTPAGGFVTTNIATRFFDKIDLSYYLTDNLKLSIGQRYEGGLNALALSAEQAFDIGKTMASVFVEGRVGEENFRGVWGGVRFYFGQHDKTLIRRQREDDPINWLPDVTALVSAKNQVTHAPSSQSPPVSPPLPPSPPPPPPPPPPPVSPPPPPPPPPPSPPPPPHFSPPPPPVY
jgi:hypothetical protein